MYGKRSTNGYHEILNGIKIKTIVYGKNSLMTEFLLAKGSDLLEHSHQHEQTGYLVKGKIELFIDLKSQVLNPGDSWCVAPNVKHRAKILEDSVAIEVFIPCRDEYKNYINNNDIIE